MVAFHLLIVELLPTAGAGPTLSFVGGALLAVGEGPYIEHARVVVPDSLLEDVLIDATFLGHIIIGHQSRDFPLEGLWVIRVLMVSIVVNPPVKPLHLLPIGGEELFYPCDDPPKVLPEVLSGRVVLVLDHTFLDALLGALSVSIPIDYLLQIVLSNGDPTEVVAPQSVSHTPRPAEVAFGFRYPGSFIDGIA